MQFQKNAWVDTKVCEEIARQFVEHKKDIHGDDWVLLFCDNLKATDALQPIDAAYGRSLRCAIGRLLDQWLLMDDENMEAWETSMSPAQTRRVLMSKLVADATEELLSNDEMRVGCFERTGMNLTKYYLHEEYNEAEFINENNAVENEEIETGWT
eukprot:CAMPEP_0176502490 /NCGR_PEP_ID=MMETSP0200_2-20121128/14783_1 /TAXON_ID=947934 /ORGANISM="Chaetoceros sp., Strain GSL56" /LENGTH=154 /DNA_ID=CAMNT_0017901569 /DNA_START=512 /DNA_END=974 /DNA_ORIENTATION=-